MRSVSRLLIVTLLAQLALVPIASAQHRQVSGFIDEITLARYGMTRRWYTQVPTLRLREKTLYLRQIEDLLFASSDKGLLHCLNAETGQLLWSQSVSNTPGEVFPPAVTSKYVYVTTNSRFTQLERTNGQVIQALELTSATTSGPAANDRYAYVQTLDNRISAIDLQMENPEEKNLAWPYKRKFTIPRMAWFYNAGSELLHPPILMKDRVIFTSVNGVLFNSELSKRSLYYRFIPGSKILAPVSRRGRTLYVATVDFNLYAVDALSGQTLWRFASGYPIFRQPIPFEKEVFLTPQGGGLFSLSIDRGTINWINESVNRLVAVSQERVYAMTPTNRMIILNRADGSILGSWMSPDFPVMAYNQTTDRIFLSTDRGLIQCLSETANTTPYQHDPPEPTDATTEPNKTDKEPLPGTDAPAEEMEEEPENSTDSEEMPAEESSEAPSEEPAEEEAMESEDAPAEEEMEAEPEGDAEEESSDPAAEPATEEEAP